MWLLDIATGKARRITGKGSEEVAYGGTKFSKDGKGLYTVTDRGSGFQRLTFIDLATKKHATLAADVNWNVSRSIFRTTASCRLLWTVLESPIRKGSASFPPVT